MRDEKTEHPAAREEKAERPAKREEKAEHPAKREEKNEYPAALAEQLLAWYDAGHRELPWRTEPTPYRVWISEIMLQQTRVEAVKPYFARFMDALPDVESLANVENERLMKLWEGLGYYSRARHLKAAAEQIVQAFAGIIPSSREDLLRLPGIGSYTAGAISAFAYNKREPAVDGNVLRVLARLSADDRDVLDPRTKTAVEEELRPLIPADRPGDFGQAMIEIGAVVCQPKSPRCGECPLAGLCRAHALGAESSYPVRIKKTPHRTEERTVLVVVSDRSLAICRRPDSGLLAGLWELPNVGRYMTPDEATAFVREKMGLEPLRIEELPPAKHVFTHITWEMRGYRIRVADPEPGTTAEPFVFADRETLSRRYAIPTAFSAFLKAL